MKTAGDLATHLDREMLEQSEIIRKRGAAIGLSRLNIQGLPIRTGGEVADEVNGRLLVRYLVKAEVSRAAQGTKDAVYVTPTPYSPEEAAHYLALPSGWKRRTYVMLLDPLSIEAIQGPHWVRLGGGIEYLLPLGYNSEAVVLFPIPLT